MRAKFSCMGLLAGIFAFLAKCAVANAITMTTLPEIETFNLTAPQVPQVNFEVSNSDANTPPVKIDTNSPQTASQVLTFNKFNTGLGTLTGVSITFTTSYGATATVTVPNNADSETITFFADAKIDHSLTGGFITPQSPPQQAFSASCQADPGKTCESGPQSNNNTFNGTAGLAAPLTSFNGPGTYDLTAALTSALAPRITPDNGTSFADNSTFDGTLNANWSGSVTVVYTYETGAAVPEPLSLYLLVAGLGGLALSRRRR
ncbi:MAG TPA: choice-of-anchor E domain-containing protein [Methylomirabilota bacterium]|nr:choice-of-anchor E domain-containing protein [Methylomirabilota bacterium]